MKTATKKTKKARAKRHGKNISEEKISRFPWGRVLKVHTLGNIDIIESAERKTDGCTVTKQETGKSVYHAYVNGEDTSVSYDSLEKSIISALAYKHLGLNQYALVDGIIRMLKL
jgi:hypothetical protein